LKYLGWILLLVVLTIGIILYSTKYQALQNRLDQQARETEMWIGKTEQMKRKAALGETRQRMAPDVSLLLADVFPGMDSFNLTRIGRDTLATLAKQLRFTQGQITVSVFTDDSSVSLPTKLKYPDAFSFAAAKGAAVVRYLAGQGVPSNRIALVAYGSGRERSPTIPDLRRISSRRLEISVLAGAP
jgi:outer membrane protein OmpA-like peptidoglycan-associated protein